MGTFLFILIIFLVLGLIIWIAVYLPYSNKRSFMKHPFRSNMIIPDNIKYRNRHIKYNNENNINVIKNDDYKRNMHNQDTPVFINSDTSYNDFIGHSGTHTLNDNHSSGFDGNFGGGTFSGGGAGDSWDSIDSSDYSSSSND